jgi:hypothetical protein
VSSKGHSGRKLKGRHKGGPSTVDAGFGSDALFWTGLEAWLGHWPLGPDANEELEEAKCITCGKTFIRPTMKSMTEKHARGQTKKVLGKYCSRNCGKGGAKLRKDRAWLKQL